MKQISKTAPKVKNLNFNLSTINKAKCTKQSNSSSRCPLIRIRLQHDYIYNCVPKRLY